MRIPAIAIIGLALISGACVYTPPGVVPPNSPAAAVSAPIASNCREFSDTITINGQPQQAHGTACQQPDGSWRIVDQGQSGTPGAPATTQTVPGYYPAYPYPYDPYYSYPYYPYYYGPPVALGLGFGIGFHRHCFRCF